jgi:hypothetical protein
VAEAIDRERLAACPKCEVVFVPETHAARSGREERSCPFCGDREGLLGLAEAQGAGLVERDGEGSWRVRHRPVPGWATEHVDAEEEEPR